MAAGDQSGWGVSHLSSMPITLTYGLVLLGVLIALILLRIVFGNISVGGSAGVK